MPTLDWVGRETAERARGREPFRVLEERPELGYGDSSCGNMLVQGDNLAALKALLPFYAGQVKCVYIDPPYNTGAAFEHYDDNLEHSVWLSIMYPRIELLRDFLAEDGFFWLILDNTELAYCKAILDEIFGRKNFLNMICTTTNEPSGFKATAGNIFATANYMLCYARDKSKATINKLFVEKPYDKAYGKYMVNRDQSYAQWEWESLSGALSKELGCRSICEAKKKMGKEEWERRLAQFAFSHADSVFRTAAIGGGARKKRLETINASKLSKDKIFVYPQEDVDGFYILNGEQVLFYSERLTVIDGRVCPGQCLTDVWTDISWTGIAGEGGVEFKNAKKPEKLVQRVLALSTKPGDLVMDSFLGSGTTAAVAQKMGRRWIGVEMGEQAKTHCVERLRKVAEGDPSGVSKAVGWKGGGGFRFYELGEPLLDEEGGVRASIPFGTLAAHVWFAETGRPFGRREGSSTFLGVWEGKGYALLYNGILHDRSVGGGNVLTGRTLEVIRADAGKAEFGRLVVFGEWSRLGPERLRELEIDFRQIPYDVIVRA